MSSSRKKVEIHIQVKRSSRKGLAWSLGNVLRREDRRSSGMEEVCISEGEKKIVFEEGCKLRG